MQAIRTVESSGNYGAVGPTHPRYGRALGGYQIMEANLPAWSQQALGRFVNAGEFLKDAALQGLIASKQMAKLFQKFGNWHDVASAWLSGRSMAAAGNASDSLGTTVREYVAKVNSAMGQMSDAVKTGATAGTQ